jgi:hypothetical protein
MIADVDFRFVNEDSPMILGLPDITMMGWSINESVLILRDGSVLPLHANNGHLFLRWIHQPPDGVPTTLYTKEEHKDPHEKRTPALAKNGRFPETLTTRSIVRVPTYTCNDTCIA